MNNTNTIQIENWQHSHDFSVKNLKGEKRTKYVLGLTILIMIVEIIGGSVFGSMALIADGWHMGTHVAVFFIAIFAYRYSRVNAHNKNFSFGTGKVNILAGFASAMALMIVAFVMIMESVHRLLEPQIIQFNQAIMVASIGLVVNLISAFLLKDNHSHSHHEHEHHHHDHNLKAAYLHVLADALTSILAIFALLLGKYYGLSWMDPFMGIVGALIITKWSVGLLKQTSPILLDSSIPEDYRLKIQQVLEANTSDKISDLHIWEVGPSHYAAIISIVANNPKTPKQYKDLLSKFKKLSHITIEVNSLK
jgi:cation diffusion facilitator family transporter